MYNNDYTTISPYFRVKMIVLLLLLFFALLGFELRMSHLLGSALQLEPLYQPCFIIFDVRYISGLPEELFLSLDSKFYMVSLFLP
jgi:hypothetical protein